MRVIKSAIDESPIEVLLKDAAKQLGATYKEGWWGKGIQEGNGEWNGGNWAVLVDEDVYTGEPRIHFLAKKDSTVTPMNAVGVESESIPNDIVEWIENKINESTVEHNTFEDKVNQLQQFPNDLINYVYTLNESKSEVAVELDTEDEEKAKDVAEEIIHEDNFNDCSYEIYDFYELSEDKYDDLDPRYRDTKVIVFYL